MRRSVLTENHRGEGGSLRKHLAIHPKQHPKIQFPGRAFAAASAPRPLSETPQSTREPRGSRGANSPASLLRRPLCPRAVSCGFSRTSCGLWTGFFSRKISPEGRKKRRLPAVTPLALSKSGVYSESLIIKIAPTECMRCDK